MALTAEQTTAQNFKNFFDRIRPLLNSQHYHVDRSGQELKNAYLKLSEHQTISAEDTLINFDLVSGSFQVSNHKVLIPDSVKRIQLDISLSGRPGANVQIDTTYIVYDYKNATEVARGNLVYLGSGYAWDGSVSAQYDIPTGGAEIGVIAKYVHKTGHQIDANVSCFTVQEIGRIVDPVQYVSSGDNLEETPVGNIISYMGNNVPKHYLACDGHEYPIGSYPELEAHFISEFGSVNYFGGDGTSTFAVPDLRGEFLRGTGTNSHTNQGSGANVGVHQNGTATPSISSGYDGLYINNIPASGTNGSDNVDAGYKKNASNRSASVNIAGTWATTADNMIISRPTNTSVQYCIKYESTYHVIVPSHAYKVSVAASVTASSQVQITFDSSDIIGDSSLISGNTFVAPMSGWYSVGMNWSQGGSGEVGYYVKINGNNAGYNRGIILSNTYYMNKGDSLALYKESGSANSGRVNFCLLTSNYNENIIAGGEVYSATEQEIGVSVDGKKLYQKTITFNTTAGGSASTPVVTVHDFSTDVSNIETIYKWTALGRVAGSSNDYAFVPFYGSDHTLGVDAHLDNTIYFYVSSHYTASMEMVVTIQYTKTTDAANTYTYKNSLLLTRPDQWEDGVEYDFGGGLYGVRFTGTVSTSVEAGSNVWTQIVNRGVGLSSAPKMMNFGGWIEFVTNGQKSVTPANSPRIWQLQISVYFAMGGSFRMQVISGVDGTTPSTMAIPADGKYDVWVTYMK